MAETILPYPVLLTHRGWFGICPVYLSEIHSEAPLIVERRAWLSALMPVSYWLQTIWIFLKTRPFGGGAAWSLRISGELDEPLWLLDDGSVSRRPR